MHKMEIITRQAAVVTLLVLGAAHICLGFDLQLAIADGPIGHRPPDCDLQEAVADSPVGHTTTVDCRPECPKCERLSDIEKHWVKESILKEEGAIDECKTACRTRLDSKTLAGVRMIEKQDNAPVLHVCYCGDEDVSLLSQEACSYECPGGGDQCGGPQAVSVYPVCPPCKYGSSCTLDCPGHCADDVCDVDTGVCNGKCRMDWFGSTYCKRQCGHCWHDICDQETGVCIGHCDTGFYKPDCNSECSIHCVMHSCHMNDGRCLHGCDDGWYGSHCDKNCPTNCVDECDQITGNCLECSPGHYGKTCDTQCPVNCGESLCDFVTGFCSSGCIKGFYGPKCNMSCPDNCNMATCSQDNGVCRFGCENGYHGYRCYDICSDNCLNSTCHSRTGHCMHGCERGSYGPEFCDLVCPEKCVEDDCDMMDGDCFGCDAGWTGSRCDSDIDECSEDSLNICSFWPTGTKCYNTPGSYVCCDTVFDNETQTCEATQQETSVTPVWVWPVLASAVLAIIALSVVAVLSKRGKVQKHDRITRHEQTQVGEIQMCHTNISVENDYGLSNHVTAIENESEEGGISAC